MAAHHCTPGKGKLRAQQNTMIETDSEQSVPIVVKRNASGK